MFSIRHDESVELPTQLSVSGAEGNLLSANSIRYARGMRKIALALLAAAFVLAPAASAAPPDEITLADLNLGEYWAGPKISKKDLLGKVVLVEIYGS